MLHNIRNTIREMIKVMIIAFALVLALNTLLQVTNLSQSEFAKSLIAGGGNSSPDTLLFWLLFSAILAFFWAQIRSRGARNTFNKCLSTPRWILLSVKTARSSAFPLMMIGVAIALIIRFFLLTTPTAVTFLVVMFGILYSQQESLWVLIMSLGYSDIIRFFRKGRSVIPAPGYPVMGVCGAFCGFLFVLFYPDNLLIIILIVVLLLAGSVVLLYRKKKPTTPVAPAGTTMLGRKVS